MFVKHCLLLLQRSFMFLPLTSINLLKSQESSMNNAQSLVGPLSTKSNGPRALSAIRTGSSHVGEANLTIDTTKERIRKLFNNVQLSVSSYDTTWVAMVPSPNSPKSPCFSQCLNWLINNQLNDGSWGLVYNNHNQLLLKDSLSSTLASILALKRWNVGEDQINKAKMVLRYLKGTTDYGLWYSKGSNEELKVFTDSDYARDSEDRKSTSGYVCLFNNTAVSRSTTKQEIVTLSSTHAECVAVVNCACHCKWLKGLLEDLGEQQASAVNIMCDNKSTIKLSENPVRLKRTKHIDVVIIT